MRLQQHHHAASSASRTTSRSRPCAAAAAAPATRAAAAATKRPRRVCVTACAGAGGNSTSSSNNDYDSEAFCIPHSSSSSSLVFDAELFHALKAPNNNAQQRPKVFVFVRHGHSTWNEQSRIQGNTDESELTALGRLQAVRARVALSEMQFDSCFSSPHTRARQTAEIVWGRGDQHHHHHQQQWQDHQQKQQQLPPICYLPSLAEADLGWFQGLRNADIAAAHPELYATWRDEPERFVLDGRYPVLDAFRQARRAWTDMLSQPGSTHLVITHKSLLRAMLCTALGLPPRQFRAIDLANGAVCMVRCNARGDLMLSANNLTSHLYFDDVRYSLPGSNSNDRLAAAATAGAPAATPAAAAVNGSSGSRGA